MTQQDHHTTNGTDDEEEPRNEPQGPPPRDPRTSRGAQQGMPTDDGGSPPPEDGPTTSAGGQRTKPPVPNVTLFVRLEPEMGLEERKHRTVERLEDLRSRGSITDFDIFVWTKEIRPDGPLQESTYCQQLLEHVERLRDWYEGADGASEAFDHHDVESPVTDDHYDVITLPSICLGVYQGDELVEVYPRRDGEGLESVPDGLEELAVPRLEASD